MCTLQTGLLCSGAVSVCCKLFIVCSLWNLISLNYNTLCLLFFSGGGGRKGHVLSLPVNFVGEFLLLMLYSGFFLFLGGGGGDVKACCVADG